MRDYSKPFYDINELTAAFNGVCKKLGKEDYCCVSSMPLLGQQIAKLAQTEGIHINPSEAVQQFTDPSMFEGFRPTIDLIAAIISR